MMIITSSSFHALANLPSSLLIAGPSWFQLKFSQVFFGPFSTSYAQIQRPKMAIKNTKAVIWATIKFWFGYSREKWTINWSICQVKCDVIWQLWKLTKTTLRKAVFSGRTLSGDWKAFAFVPILHSNLIFRNAKCQSNQRGETTSKQT